MTYRSIKHIKIVSVIFLLLLLNGCGGNDYAKQIDQNYTQVKINLDNLERKLYYKQLTNAKIVNIYAAKLARIKPDFKPIAEAMAKDATEKGILYQGLLKRLKKINRDPENKQQFQKANESLMSIDMGADPIVFNDALIDLINTMAELSDGQLETVSIPKESQAANVRGEVTTPGSYLVGNPGYGEYRQDNSGRSLWHWYGQYAFFSNVLGGGYNRNPIYYNNWNRGYHNSYYHDYGRNSYGSSYDRSQTSQHNQTMRDNGVTPATKPKKQYGSASGRKRVSSYARQRTNNSSYFSKKQTGGRHSDKAVSKRSSNTFSHKKTASSPKRSSSFFGSSSRSSRSSGGK